MIFISDFGGQEFKSQAAAAFTGGITHASHTVKQDIKIIQIRNNRCFTEHLQDLKQA